MKDPLGGKKGRGVEVSIGSGYQLGFPALLRILLRGDVVAPPSRPPSLGKRAPQALFFDSLKPHGS